MKKSILISIFLVLFVVSCNSKSNNTDANKENNKIKVVTTIFPIYDFARNILLDNSSLKMIIRPGIEIHSFNASPSDIIDIQNADVFIYIGGESEEWAQNVISSMDTDTNGKKIIKLIDYVNALDEEIVEGMEHDEEHNHDEELNHEEHDNISEMHTHEGVYDEHIWTSPKNAVLMVNAISKAMSEIDPNNADVYKANADKYNSELYTLDNDFRDTINSSKRKDIVFGDRFPFRYLADEYGLNYRAPFNGCSSQSDVSPKTLTYLIGYIKDNNIPYLYYIELSNEKIANTIIEQTGAAKLKLHSAQSITKKEFDDGASYLSIMRDNLESLKKGLN